MKNKLVTLLGSNLDTLMSMNLFVCVFTYLILVVYCIISLSLTNSDPNLSEAQQLINDWQFYLDALVPTTLTIVISMIVQILQNRTEFAGWMVPAAPIPFIAIYAMVCMGFRQIKSAVQFWSLVAFSVAILVGTFLAIAWIQKHAKNVSASNLHISA